MQDVPEIPVDGRFVSRAGQKWSENKTLVHEFLEEIYHTLSEPAPEASESLSSHPSALRFRKRRGRAPKLALLQRKLKAKKKADGKAPQTQMRLLPPGTFTDYLALLQARHPHRKISLKRFSSESGLF